MNSTLSVAQPHDDDDDIPSTIGVEFHTLTVTGDDGTRIKAHIWDTGAFGGLSCSLVLITVPYQLARLDFVATTQRGKSGTTPSSNRTCHTHTQCCAELLVVSHCFLVSVNRHYRKADGVVLIYDVNDPQSFDHAVGRWLDDVKAYTEEADHAAMLEGSMLLGNKSGKMNLHLPPNAFAKLSLIPTQQPDLPERISKTQEAIAADRAGIQMMVRRALQFAVLSLSQRSPTVVCKLRRPEHRPKRAKECERRSKRCFDRCTTFTAAKRPTPNQARRRPPLLLLLLALPPSMSRAATRTRSASRAASAFCRKTNANRCFPSLFVPL